MGISGGVVTVTLIDVTTKFTTLFTGTASSRTWSTFANLSAAPTFGGPGHPVVTDPAGCKVSEGVFVGDPGCWCSMTSDAASKSQEIKSSFAHPPAAPVSQTTITSAPEMHTMAPRQDTLALGWTTDEAGCVRPQGVYGLPGAWCSFMSRILSVDAAHSSSPTTTSVALATATFTFSDDYTTGTTTITYEDFSS
ncbi:hypothetical protein LTS18_005042, partial [Coniosporium uncinatum]